MSLRSWLRGLVGSVGSSIDIRELVRSEDVDAALLSSEKAPVWIYKHSTRCVISLMAMQQVRSYLESAGPTRPVFYMVNVVERRAVSNRIAEQLQIAHESPQLFLVQGRSVVWQASHTAIRRDALERAVVALGRGSSSHV